MRMHADKIFQNPPPISDERFLKVKMETENLYRSIVKVHCPYLKTDVTFNAEGLEHMKFKEWNKERVRNEQYFRLKFFYMVPDVIKHSHTLQGRWETKGWERKKSHGKWVKELVNVNFFEFIAVIGKVRVKVIVKQINGGQPFFWSIIPFWHMTDLNEIKQRRERILHDGNPESD